MANEKRLIDANELAMRVDESKHYNPHPQGLIRVNHRNEHDHFLRMILDAPTVDAVEANEYEALVGMYHELRENFVDFVCSGVPNVAPYCLNRCDGCCDAYGW